MQIYNPDGPSVKPAPRSVFVVRLRLASGKWLEVSPFDSFEEGCEAARWFASLDSAIRLYAVVERERE
jgi:hypothetical protein